jgi:hypothetical protein
MREAARKSPTNTLDIAVYLASWPTPMAGTPAQNGYNEAGNTDSGRKTVALASWLTPTATARPLNEEAVMLVSGPTSAGSPAPTERPAQLNPDFTRWLMGYSAEHLSCAPTAMPSSRKSRLNLFAGSCHENPGGA